jgi:hypothetical protein
MLFPITFLQLWTLKFKLKSVFRQSEKHSVHSNDALIVFQFTVIHSCFVRAGKSKPMDYALISTKISQIYETNVKFMRTKPKFD